MKRSEMSENAKEALELLDYIKENGAVEVYDKFTTSRSFIEDKGYVSQAFLQKLKQTKQEISKR